MVNYEDYRKAARRRLPKVIFDFVDGGAGDEHTVRANEAAFQAIRFAPRNLVDVSERSQRTTVLGRPIETPVILGPSAPQRAVHRDGERAAARAATRAGTIFALSTGGSCTIEEVAEASGDGGRWFQVYMWRSRDLVRSLVERADRAGYHAVVLTIDTATAPVSDRNLRNGLLGSSKPAGPYEGHQRVIPRPRLSHIIDGLRHPGWLLRDYLLAPPITFKVVTAEDLKFAATSFVGTGTTGKRMNETATWDEVRFVRSVWRGPFVVKGILTVEDARLAFDNGADAVIVSNHGGRHLDGMPATIDVLPRIAELGAARGKEVYLDSGVRRGVDVVRAIALGARAVLIARPYWWALAVDGEDGVVRYLDLLKKEIDTALGSLGRPTLADLDPSVLDLTASPWLLAWSRERANTSGG